MKGTLYFNTITNRYYLATGKIWLFEWYNNKWNLSLYTNACVHAESFIHIGNNYASR